MINSKDDVIGTVLESSISYIEIEIKDKNIFEKNKDFLQIGKYLKVEIGNIDCLVVIIYNIRLNKTMNVNDSESKLTFILQTQPIGLIHDDKFERGSLMLPVPTEPVSLIDSDTLALLYSRSESYAFKFGRLVQNKETNLYIDGNKFFSKHIAIVGSTGAGKSCTVARILQDVVGISNAKNNNIGKQNNAHIIIFDIHSEYKYAFDVAKEEDFTLNVLDVDSLILPYWLMNSEELENIFIESNEANSHNQVSQFKKAVILNKERHNPSLKDKINYDTPVYFDIKEVFNYISNINNLTTYLKEGKIYFAVLNIYDEFDTNKLWNLIDFEESTGNSSHPKLGAKVSKAGGFNGEFDRFVSRLETKLNDKRLKFLLAPRNKNEEEYKTDDFETILKQFLGYINKSNITILDLSGIPFEVLSITVSLVSRLIFDFSFHYSKLKHSENLLNDVPFMIVCEEAHNYVPRDNSADYKPSRKSIERIAKEGRKYGISLMVVSQRPSEVSETIFAQCNNFISLRLTNTNDQSYIRSLMPENSNAIADILPNLAAGQCLIVGEAVPLPSIVQLELPNPMPKSETINFHDNWVDDWKDITFTDIVNRWKKDK